MPRWVRKSSSSFRNLRQKIRNPHRSVKNDTYELLKNDTYKLLNTSVTLFLHIELRDSHSIPITPRILPTSIKNIKNGSYISFFSNTKYLACCSLQFISVKSRILFLSTWFLSFKRSQSFIIDKLRHWGLIISY